VSGAPGVLSSNEQFYSWINDNLISVIYKDAQCGNGICEFPEEVKGVGEYGWYQYFYSLLFWHDCLLV
jgi:hypothetical protein